MVIFRSGLIPRRARLDPALAGIRRAISSSRSRRRELVDPSVTAIAASNRLTTTTSLQSSLAQEIEARNIEVHGGSTASPLPAMAVTMNERDHDRLPDIDMDNSIAISLMASSRSSFASLASLALRIRMQKTVETSFNANSVDHVPSNIMQWDRSSSHSFRIFGLSSSRPSIASSTMMNWRATTTQAVGETLSNASPAQY